MRIACREFYWFNCNGKNALAKKLFARSWRRSCLTAIWKAKKNMEINCHKTSDATYSIYYSNHPFANLFVPCTSLTHTNCKRALRFNAPTICLKRKDKKRIQRRFVPIGYSCFSSWVIFTYRFLHKLCDSNCFRFFYLPWLLISR